MAKGSTGRPIGTRFPIEPQEKPPKVDLLEKYAGVSRDDPARTRIMFALSELTGKFDINIMEHPEILAKGIEKGRRDYENEVSLAARKAKDAAAAKEREARNPTSPVIDRPNACVYYLAVGKLIKIGTTIQLENRVRSYPPGTVVLATEPGSYALERQRHKQFASAHAARNEWFHPSADLIAHINTLRETPLSAVDLAA